MVDATVKNKTTFQIGLVLAGAVSAGAYSAGVVDFLIEALDQWYAARESEIARGVPSERRLAPPHDVCLRAISGSSAGSMVAALAAVALNETPCPVDPKNPPGKHDKTNKLYSSWVTEADIVSMLATADLKENAGQMSSLLDSSFLMKLAEETITARPPCFPRSYVADPLALFICVTNLRGVPYSIDFRGARVVEHWMSNHADYLRFDVVKPAVSRNAGNGFLLHPDPRDAGEKEDWNNLARAAVASGAFPLALAPRIIRRDASDYNRWTVPPDWNGGAPRDYFFLAVDGGVMNNEPLEYARQEIAGAGRRDARDGEKASRAIVMVDPFPDAVPVRDDYTAASGLFDVAGAIFRSLMSQAKFKIDEIALARDPNDFSRFVITPTRDRTPRESPGERWPALASNSLFHFGGFLHEEFRRHDFLLGRRNCQRFLQKYFILPVENPLFAAWPDALKRPGSPYLRIIPTDGKDTYYLPIIPLVGDLNGETREPQPPWPEMPAARLDTLKKGLTLRTRLVINQLVAGLIGSGGNSVFLKIGFFVLKLIMRPLIGWFAGWLVGKLLRKIRENLATAQLLKTAR